MNFGIIGLGRMGGSVARLAMEKGHRVAGYNEPSKITQDLAKEGLLAAFSLAELVEKLQVPRILVMYVPHGEPTDTTIAELAKLLHPGDLVADGGNSHWKDSVRHYEELRAVGVSFLDVGTSGGVDGARTGACFMVGGDVEAFAMVETLLRVVRPHESPQTPGAVTGAVTD